MNRFRVILFLASSFAFYRSYNDLPIIPDFTPNTPSVVVVDEVFPVQPNPVLLASTASLDQVLTDQGDALVFARFFRDFAEVLGRDSYITSVDHFVSVQDRAAISLLLHTKIEGKYQGKINAAMKGVYNQALSYLKGPDGTVKSTDITPQVRASLVEYLNALSWKCYQISQGKKVAGMVNVSQYIVSLAGDN